MQNVVDESADLSQTIHGSASTASMKSNSTPESRNAVEIYRQLPFRPGQLVQHPSQILTNTSLWLNLVWTILTKTQCLL